MTTDEPTPQDLEICEAKKLTITLYIEAAAAVRAGSNRCGPIKFRPSAEQITALTPEQREALALHLDEMPGPFSDGPHWGEFLTEHAPPIGIVTFDIFRSLLDRRRVVMNEAYGQAAKEGMAIYLVQIDDGPWSAPLTAAASRTIYREAIANRSGVLIDVNGEAARINRLDGVAVARSQAAQLAGEKIDVAAQKVWHRAATGLVPNPLRGDAP